MELDDTLYIWYNQMNLRTESAPPSSTQSLTNIIEVVSLRQTQNLIYAKVFLTSYKIFG